MNRFFGTLAALLLLMPALYGQNISVPHTNVDGITYITQVTCTATAACNPVKGVTTLFNVPLGIGWWKISWTVDGSPTCAVTVDSATNAGASPSVGNLIASQNCGAAGSFTATTAKYANYAQITPTITGAGVSVTFTLTGYINNPGSVGSTNSTIISPVDGSGYVNVDCQTGCNGSNASVSATGSAVPASATYLGVRNGANLIGVVQGSAVSASSLPVVIASDQAAIPTSEGGSTGAAVPARAEFMGVKNGANLVGLLEGSAVSANSIPVVIASDQTALPNALPTPSATVLSNQQAVTASAVALATNSAKNVCVKALITNALNVYVGTAGVTTATGLELSPGDGFCEPISNTNLVYVIASSTGSSVSWMAIN